MKIELTKQETTGLVARSQALKETESKLVMMRESQEYYLRELATKYEQTTKIISFNADTGVLEFEEPVKKGDDILEILREDE